MGCLGWGRLILDSRDVDGGESGDGRDGGGGGNGVA